MTKIRTQKKKRGGNHHNNRQKKSYRRKKSYQVGGNIEKISNKVELMLIHDKLDFIPTGRIAEDNYKHYLNMIDYIRLQKIVDDNPEFKMSPTIQFIFDYNSYKIEEADKIVFNYKNINCNNLVDKQQMNYYVSLLFLYLLECNKVREDQMGGGGEDVKKEDSPGLSFIDKVNMDDNKPDENMDDNKPEENMDDNKPEENLEPVIGFEEYEAKRNELEKVYIHNTGLVYYELDWFHACIGFKKLDKGFEDEVKARLKLNGIVLEEDVIDQKVNEVLENKELAKFLKQSIKSRMLSCSNKPLTFFDKIFGNVSYSSLKSCDKKDKNESLLYMYDEYEPIIFGEIDTMNKLDLVGFLSYCETRQLMLSKYISLEMVRREKDNTSEVMDILKKIYKLDSNDINENRKLLDSRLEKEKEVIKAMKMKKEKMNITGDIDASNDLYEGINDDLNKGNTEEFIQQMNEAIKKEEGDILLNNIRGGSSSFVNVDELRAKKECELIKMNKNIYLYQLPFIDKC